MSRYGCRSSSYAGSPPPSTRAAHLGSVTRYAVLPRAGYATTSGPARPSSSRKLAWSRTSARRAPATVGRGMPPIVAGRPAIGRRLPAVGGDVGRVASPVGGAIFAGIPAVVRGAKVGVVERGLDPLPF